MPPLRRVKLKERPRIFRERHDLRDGRGDGRRDRQNDGGHNSRNGRSARTNQEPSSAQIHRLLFFFAFRLGGRMTAKRIFFTGNGSPALRQSLMNFRS